jgi:translation initiation factor IF-3
MFRGREMARTELGRKILDRLVADLGDTIIVDASPKQDGRNMVMVIAPSKKAPEKPEPSKPRTVEPAASTAEPEPAAAEPEPAAAAPPQEA